MYTIATMSLMQIAERPHSPYGKVINLITYVFIFSYHRYIYSKDSIEKLTVAFKDHSSLNHIL